MTKPCPVCEVNVLPGKDDSCPNCGFQFPQQTEDSGKARQSQVIRPVPEKRSAKRVLAMVLGWVIIAVAMSALAMFIASIASGRALHLNNLFHLLFLAGFLGLGCGLIVRIGRRRALILGSILMVILGLAGRETLGRQRFIIETKGDKYVSTYNGMHIQMGTNVAHRDLMKTALLQLSQRRLDSSLLKDKTLTIVHYASGANFMIDAGINSVEMCDQANLKYGDTYFTAIYRMRGDVNRAQTLAEQTSDRLWFSIVNVLPLVHEGLCPGCRDKSNWTTCNCCGVSYCSRCADIRYLHLSK